MLSLQNHPTTGKRNFEKIAVAFAASIQEAERAFLYASWYDPVQMVAVACDLDLDHSSFADPENQHVFAYLGACAEFGHKNTIVECVGLARAEGLLTASVADLELTDSILRERAEYPGDIRTEIRPRGMVLKGAVENRILARQHIKVALDLVGCDGFNELLSARTNGKCSWKRRRNPRKVTYVG